MMRGVSSLGTLASDNAGTSVDEDFRHGTDRQSRTRVDSGVAVLRRWSPGM